MPLGPSLLSAFVFSSSHRAPSPSLLASAREYPCLSSRLPSGPKRSPPSAPPSARQPAMDFCLQLKLPGSSGPPGLLCPPLRLPPPRALHPPAFPSAWVSTVISRASAPIRARRPACHWPRRIFRRPAGWSSGPRLPRLPAHAESSQAGRQVTCPNSSRPRSGAAPRRGSQGSAARERGRWLSSGRVRAPPSPALPGFAPDAGAQRSPLALRWQPAGRQAGGCLGSAELGGWRVPLWDRPG